MLVLLALPALKALRELRSISLVKLLPLAIFPLPEIQLMMPISSPQMVIFMFGMAIAGIMLVRSLARKALLAHKEFRATLVQLALRARLGPPGRKVFKASKVM